MADGDLTITVELGVRYESFFIDSHGWAERSNHPADVLRLAEAIGPKAAAEIREAIRVLAEKRAVAAERARDSVKSAERRLAEAESQRADAELLARTLAPGES